MYPDPPTTAARTAIAAVYTDLHIYAIRVSRRSLRRRRTPNHSRTAPPTVSFTATIQSVMLRPAWLVSVTMLVGSLRS